jgi:hypothetical protein
VTNLTADAVRRLDAINIVAAYLDGDPVMAVAIAGLHPTREELRDLLAARALTAVFLARAVPDGAALLAKLREHWLDGDAR